MQEEKIKKYLIRIRKIVVTVRSGMLITYIY